VANSLQFTLFRSW